MIKVYLDTLEACKYNPEIEHVVYECEIRLTGYRPEAFVTLCEQAGLEVTKAWAYAGWRIVWHTQRPEK